MIEITVLARDSAWSTALPDAAAVARRAAAAALEDALAATNLDAGPDAGPDAGGDLPGRVELGVVLADDSFVRTLNRTWRGQDRATDVLSFPIHEQAAGLRPQAALPLMLGDVVLARETVQRDSAAAGVGLAARVSHLVVHGVLHLLGHDHDEPAAERRMRALESRTLLGLGFCDPYATL